MGIEVSGDRQQLAAQFGNRSFRSSLFPVAVQRIIYTTNAIESLHSQVRKTIRGRGHFPDDEVATKLIWLALGNIAAKWKYPPIAWHAAKAQFAMQFEERFVVTPA